MARFDRQRAGRAQAVVVGAVVLFGFAVALLGLLQLQVVPAQVGAAEVVHGELVGEELVAVGAANWEAATRGDVGTTEVTTGLNYRHRFLLMTPPPARGRLALEPLGTVSVANVVSVEGADVTGTVGPFETAALGYTPAYSRYENPPTVVLEPHVAYDRFDDGVEVVEGEWSFVDGTRITLVAVTGSLSSDGRLTETVRVVPVSAPATAVSVTNTTDGPVTLSVPTRLSNDSWATILAPQSVDNGGHVVSHAVADGVLTVVLEAGVEYDLRLARVGIRAAGASATEPATHVVTVEGADRSVPPGGSQLLVVEARDRFNNPVVGATVRADAAGANGTVTSTSRLSEDPAVGVTDHRGRASFVVRAAPDALVDTGTVTVELVTPPAPLVPTATPTPTPTPTPTATPTPAPTPTATPTPTPQPNRPPSVDSVVADTQCTDASWFGCRERTVTVEWVASDPDGGGDIESVTVVTYEDVWFWTEEVDRVEVTNGDLTSGRVTRVVDDADLVRVIVTDRAGETDDRTESV